MAFVPVPMDDVQRTVAADVVDALAAGHLAVVRPALAAAERKRIWLSPPLLSVAGGVLGVLAGADTRKPWQYTDELWDEHLPDQKPRTAAEWRHANFAIHAAGCLAGGIWLDVGRTESFWRGPFWVDVLPVIELLSAVARAQLSLSSEQLAERLRALLSLSRPNVPLA